MPNLKDYMAGDVANVFFNLGEFAETVTIDGKPQKVIIDNDHLQKRMAEYGGISTGMILYFIPVPDLPKKPSIGGYQNFNGRPMYIEDVKENMGVYEILLSQNRSE